MTKKIFTTITLLAVGISFVGSGVYTESFPRAKVRHYKIGTQQFRYIPNNAFSVGEKLTFDIDYGPLTVGTAVMAIPRIKEFNGHEVFEVNATVVSNKYISKVYPVRDEFISYIDTTGIFSHRFEKHLSEGRYKRDRIFTFDQDKNLAYSRRDTIDIPAFIQDVISAFYYVRTLELKVGDVIEISHYDNGKVYDLVVEVLKKQQVRVPAGKFDCIVIEPKLKTQALFKNEGKIIIYLTDDERKIPVLMVSKVIFGQIAAKLSKIEKEILP